MILLLAASLFFTDPAPLDMPRAAAFLVKEDGRIRLEDRFNKTDLWLSRVLIGRWLDDEGRVFTLAKLDVLPPAIAENDVQTRTTYAKECVALNKKDQKRLAQTVAELAPCPVCEKPRPPRQLPRGFKEVDYWQEATNITTIVCSFLPEKSESWFLVVWELTEDDNIYEKMGLFEDEFLRKGFKDVVAEPPPSWQVGERELLRYDVRHAVAAYPKWRCTDSSEFSVIDDLPYRGFVETLTNDLPVMRRKYAETIPSPIDTSNVLSVARIYADRDEYLEALGEDSDMLWTAAYWSQERRELVAHLSQGGEAELLKTIRHEAFHQYLSYATSMLPTSPWFNEGYAQYFEDEKDDSWGGEFDVSPDGIAKMSEMLPALLLMDYEQFYGGTDFERRFKYRLAWSIAYFIEKGAHKVRFEPFAALKDTYIKTLLETQDMRKATGAAIGSSDKLKLFVAEWTKFWKKH